MTDRRICATCSRSWYRDDGNVSCGAEVNDARLQADAPRQRAGADLGPENPIWAERKYGRDRLLSAFAGDTDEPAGSDCEDLSPADGADCKVWARRAMTRAVIEDDARQLPAAIRRLAAAWARDPTSIPTDVSVRGHIVPGPLDEGRSDRGAVVPPDDALLDAAARYLAEGWEVEVVHVFGGTKPDVVLGRYEGELAT